MRNFIARTACVWFMFVVAVSPAAEYARPEFLIEPTELAEMLATNRTVDPDRGMVLVSRPIVLLDVRPEAEWLGGCLPFAQWIDIREWKAAFGDGSDAAAWTERLRGVAPAARGTVVVYDKAITSNAVRAWWVLKYWGVEDVRILNGGVGGWLADGQQDLTPVLVPTMGDSDFVATPHPDRLATRAEVRGGGADTCLIDTRSDAEVARGVIPGAAHADWVRFVDPATGKMRPADELAAILGEVGFDPEKPAIAYCRSGGRASVVAFAMELMGGKQVANYVGSWNDWTSDPAAPIAKLGDPAP